jgi:hypothetical protein
MAGQFDGGILGGILSGWRMGEEDTRTRQEFKARQEDAAFQRQRQQAADAREAQQFNWIAEDRPGDVAFRDESRGVQRQHWSQGATLFNQGQEDRARALHREPLLQAREAELFGLDVEGRRQNIAAGRQQMGFAAENQAEQRRVRQRVWDEASLQDEIDKATRAVSPAFMRGQALGDWGPLKDAWNRTMGQHGAQVDAIEQGPNGQIGVLVNGKQKIFNSADELQGFIADALDPTDAFAAMGANRRGRMRDAAGGSPSYVQEIEYLRGIMPKREGESDGDHIGRVLEYRNRARSKSPDEEFRGLVAKFMADGYTKPEAAVERARAVMEQSFRQPPRGTFDDVDFSRHPWAASSQGGARRVVSVAIDTQGRYGPKGGRVAKYDDGSIGPAQ